MGSEERRVWSRGIPKTSLSLGSAYFNPWEMMAKKGPSLETEARSALRERLCGRAEENWKIQWELAPWLLQVFLMLF